MDEALKLTDVCGSTFNGKCMVTMDISLSGCETH